MNNFFHVLKKVLVISFLNIMAIPLSYDMAFWGLKSQDKTLAIRLVNIFIEKKYDETFKMLDQGADVNTQFSCIFAQDSGVQYEDYTMLHTAIELQQENVVDVLLKKNAHTNLIANRISEKCSLLGVSVLHSAVNMPKANVNIVKKLFDAGANINAVCDVNLNGKLVETVSVLCFSILHHDDKDVVALLLSQKNIDVNVAMQLSGVTKTALDIAVAKKKYEILALLLAHDRLDCNNLIRCVRRTDDERIKQMLQEALKRRNS